MGSLKVEYKSERHTLFEMQCRSTIAQNAMDCKELDYFQRGFTSDLQNYKRTSVAKIENSYTAILSDDWKKCEVWHLNSKGEKDRLIAIVSKN